jgi:hypothetical protein
MYFSLIFAEVDVHIIIAIIDITMAFLIIGARLMLTMGLDRFQQSTLKLSWTLQNGFVTCFLPLISSLKLCTCDSFHLQDIFTWNFLSVSTSWKNSMYHFEKSIIDCLLPLIVTHCFSNHCFYICITQFNLRSANCMLLEQRVTFGPAAYTGRPTYLISVDGRSLV